MSPRGSSDGVSEMQKNTSAPAKPAEAQPAAEQPSQLRPHPPLLAEPGPPGSRVRVHGSMQHPGQSATIRWARWPTRPEHGRGRRTPTTRGNTRLAVLLAMAMFVLVVDTSLMNVSIASVVHDLDTTVSGVQSAIALEALVSAAFILIGSKVGDLIGRKRAYVLGLLGYAIGALSMALAQGLTAIIIFWAIVGGLGASLLLPGDAVAHPRQLRRRDAAQGVRAGRRVGRDRGRGRAADRRLHHHLPVVAHRVPARRRRDHRGAERHQAREGRAVHGPARGRPGRRGAVDRGDGRHRARHPRVAGRRRVGRAC